ncbi:MAG: hypothetical protein LC122_12580 [Chitinophagales bacterium]|nr:hypothetical protein [Chitinophagales bacterium]
MLKIISHRANLMGAKSSRENHPEDILKAINLGFDVEIDIWHINGKEYLGHDNPEYEIKYSFVLDNCEKLWIHCKNFEILDLFASLDDDKINFFWHQEDDFVLTSQKFIWTYPRKLNIGDCSVLVMPEKLPKESEYTLEQLLSVYGICTDYPIRYKDILKL